jgi:hypothetical protein
MRLCAAGASAGAAAAKSFWGWVWAVASDRRRARRADPGAPACCARGAVGAPSARGGPVGARGRGACGDYGTAGVSMQR